MKARGPSKFNKWSFYPVLFLSLFLIYTGCAPKGLLTEAYTPSFYKIIEPLPENVVFPKNPTFIVYGDTQLGWRIEEKFLKKKNWLTWKMLLFPFYEIYWLGNAFIGGINWLRSTPDYGHQKGRAVRDAVYEEAKNSNVNFVINAGDLVDDGRRPKHWKKFLQMNNIEVPLITEIPFYPVKGNHDHSYDQQFGLPNYKAVFDYPSFYVLESPDVAIFMLDSYLIIDQYQDIEDSLQDDLFSRWIASDAHTSWLERELSRQENKFKIVVMHHPLISFGSHSHQWEEESHGRDLARKRNMLFQLFQKHNVRIVFSGHEHTYEHSFVQHNLSDSSGNQGIHIIVVGSGGAPTRKPKKNKAVIKSQTDLKKEGFQVKLLKQREMFNYILVSSLPDAISLKVIQVTGNKKKSLQIVEEIVLPR